MNEEIKKMIKRIREDEECLNETNMVNIYLSEETIESIHHIISDLKWRTPDYGLNENTEKAFNEVITLLIQYGEKSFYKEIFK